MIALVVACGSKPTPPPPTGTRIGPAIAAALDAASRATAPWLCAAHDAAGLTDATITAGKRTWTLAGHAITTTTTADTIAIAFVADAGGAAPTTLAALGRLRSKLDKVELVIALGGMGTTQAELEATLGVLAGDIPLVAVPGDLESVRALSGAVGKLSAASRHVIDGRLLRRIELPNATIATLSGALAPTRLVAGSDGCLTRTDDITAAIDAIEERPGLRILASTEAPRTAIDGEPVGDRALAAATGHVDVVVHAPVAPRATPAKTGTRDGKAIALTPGTSDATARLPGPRVAPSAGILTLAKGSWTWRAISDAER